MGVLGILEVPFYGIWMGGGGNGSVKSRVECENEI